MVCTKLNLRRELELDAQQGGKTPRAALKTVGQIQSFRRRRNPSLELPASLELPRLESWAF